MPSAGASVKVFLIVTSVLLLIGCDDLRGHVSYMHAREIIAPPYPWMKLDDHRSLQIEPIIARSSESGEWIFVDSTLHTATFFPEGADLQYATYQTDDPKVIVFVGDENRDNTCNGDYYSLVPCPRIKVFISQDGGRHFLRREVILPPLDYAAGNSSPQGGGGHGGQAALHQIPVVLVRRGVLYLALGGDAKPRIRSDASGTYYLVSTGERLVDNELLGIPYAWPEDTLPLWDWRDWASNAVWKPRSVFLFAIQLPPLESSPAYQSVSHDRPTRAELVCGWRRIDKLSAQLPPLHAVQLIGGQLAAFGKLPPFQMPLKPPYPVVPFLMASDSERERAKLLKAMQADHPDWVASQQAVAPVLPETFAPNYYTTNVKDDDVKCE